MKRMITPNWLKTAFLGAALAASTSVGFSQATDWIQTFDDSTSTGPWVAWWGTSGGGAAATITWNDSQNCTTNVPGSGSMQYDFNSVGAAGEQFMTFVGHSPGGEWHRSGSASAGFHNTGMAGNRRTTSWILHDPVNGHELDSCRPAD